MNCFLNKLCGHKFSGLETVMDIVPKNLWKIESSKDPDHVFAINFERKSGVRKKSRRRRRKINLSLPHTIHNLERLKEFKEQLEKISKQYKKQERKILNGYFFGCFLGNF